MKKKVLFTLLLGVFALALTGCLKKDLPFAEFYKLDISKDSSKWEVPVYFYSKNVQGKVEKIEGIEFFDNKMKYEFRDWKVSKPDEDGNVIITFGCDMTTDLEYYSTVTTRWYYTYKHTEPFLFDYYTGDIYKANKITDKDKDEEFEYTDIKLGKKEIEVGVISKSIFPGWAKKQDLGKVDGKFHILVPITNQIEFQVKVPEDYDGVVIALSKEGSNENNFDKEEDDDDTVRKLISRDDDDRSNVKADDYYYLRVSDFIK